MSTAPFPQVAPRSPGERLFAAYLRQRRLPWEHEREINGRNPDFSVDHPVHGTIAFEVYEPGIALPAKAGFFDTIPKLQQAFEGRKQKQIAAVRDAGLPYVAVLADTASQIPIDPRIMAGAMFGRLEFTFRVPADPAAPLPEPAGSLGFGQGGRIQPERNRGVSAVALLRKFNPTLPRLELAQDAVAQRGDPDARLRDPRVRRDFIGALHDVECHMSATGDFDPDAAAARLIILHNPHAYRPAARLGRRPRHAVGLLGVR